LTYPSPSTVNASKGLGEILTYTNTVTDSWMSNLLMIAIWVITLIGVYKAKDDFKGALAVAGYVTFVVGLLFWVGGFISGWAFGGAVAIAVIGTLVLVLDREN